LSRKKKTGRCQLSQALPARRKPMTVKEDPLPADVVYDRAFDKALRLLTYRSRSRKELKERLARAGFNQSVVEKVDARLYELGLLDDPEFARDFAEQALARGVSINLVRHELENRGVASGVVDIALADEAWGDLERARGVARRRALTYGDLPKATAFRRLAGYLAQKGYQEEVVAEVCYEVVGDPEDAENPR
jgi:regulatory protein